MSKIKDHVVLRWACSAGEAPAPVLAGAVRGCRAGTVPQALALGGGSGGTWWPVDEEDATTRGWQQRWSWASVGGPFQAPEKSSFGLPFSGFADCRDKKKKAKNWCQSPLAKFAPIPRGSFAVRCTGEDPIQDSLKKINLNVFRNCRPPPDLP